MAWRTGEACGFTLTRSGASSTPNHSAVISDTMEALDAWWPPTLTPERFGRTRFAWWTIAAASHSTRRCTSSSTSRSRSRGGRPERAASSCRSGWVTASASSRTGASAPQHEPSASSFGSARPCAPPADAGRGRSVVRLRMPGPGGQALARGDGRAQPDEGDVAAGLADGGVAAHLHTVVEYRALDHGAGPDDGAGQEDGLAHRGARLHHGPAADDAALNRAGHPGARPEQARADSRVPDKAGGGPVRGRVGEDGPRRVVEVDRRVRAEQLLVALPVGRHGADVAPEAVEAVLA